MFKLDIRVNFLNEFEEKGYDLEKLKPYSDFLFECSAKEYGDLFTQKHHILPKFMKGTNKIQNLIPLSCEDHYTSHIVLAHCFDFGTTERHKNLCSAKYVVANTKRFLRKKYGSDIKFDDSDFWINATIELKELTSGVNNPNYGRDFSQIHRKRLSDSLKLFYKNNPDAIRIPILSAETRKLFGEQLRGKFAGEKNPMFGKRVIFTDEQRINLSVALFDAADQRVPLPSNVFRCDEYINGKRKTAYRNCPSCGAIIYYYEKKRAIVAECENVKCKKCSDNYKQANKYCKKVLLVTENKIFNSRKELIDYLSISYYELNKLISAGDVKDISLPPQKQSNIHPTLTTDIRYNALVIRDIETGQIFKSKTQFRKQLKLTDRQVNEYLVSGKYEIMRK